MSNAFIVGAVRTAAGKKKGSLSGWHPIDLGGFVLDELLRRTGADPALIEDVIFGCVNQVGAQGSNIARNCVLSSMLPVSVPATTIDRQCGSSQQAVHFAAQAVMSDVHDVVIAGGVEVMSLVPIGGNAIAGNKIGYGAPYGRGMKTRYPGVRWSQFEGAETLADRYGLDRVMLDTFGLESHRRASRAIAEGRFSREIAAIDVKDEDGSSRSFNEDEGVRHGASAEAMAELKPLSERGLLTAATSSQISDGAAALLIANERGLERLGLKPRARIRAMTVVGDDPVVMLGAPIPASQRLLERSGVTINDIGLYEVNEAFASVPLAWAKALGADPERLNVNGGAIALGHPLGCTGARLMTTLLHEMERRNVRLGLQTMCEGGGLANATLLERQ